jgi:hypothetical protein
MPLINDLLLVTQDLLSLGECSRMQRRRRRRRRKMTGMRTRGRRSKRRSVDGLL